MLLLKKEWTVEGVTYGKGETTVANVGVKLQREGYRNIVVVYIPLKTDSRTEDLYKKKLEDTMECPRRLLKKKNKILIMEYFNCKEVSWESWSMEESEASWGNMALELVINNFLTQWVKETTRFRENDEPSRLYFIITREPDIIEEMNYKSPIGRSDHVFNSVHFDASS